MSDDDNTFSAVVRGVHVERLGDTLAVAAAIGDTVLTVNNTADFDEEGGFLRLRGAVYEYLSCDDEANTITLAAALPVVASIDTKVDVWDEQNGQPAALHKAVVDQIDGFDGVATVVVKQSVAHALSQNMRDGKGETVTLKREPGGQIHLADVHGRAFALAALQYLQGGITTRQAEDESGVDILGVDSGTPGFYLYDTGGVLSLQITDDAVAGVIKCWTGLVGEDSPTIINPTTRTIFGVDGPGLKIVTGTIGSSFNLPAHIELFTGGGSVTAQINLTGVVNTNTDVFIGNKGWAAGGFQITGGDLIVDNQSGTGTVTAQLNSSGRLIRTPSSKRYKSNIKPLKPADARKVLDLEPVTFTLKDEAKDKNRRTYPGFIAEQAAEVGADLWVDRDAEGNPDGFRYAEVAAALIPIIKDQQKQIDDLTARLTALEARSG